MTGFDEIKNYVLSYVRENFDAENFAEDICMQRYDNFVDVLRFVCGVTIKYYLDGYAELRDVEDCMIDEMVDCFILQIGKWYGEKQEGIPTEKIDSDELYNEFEAFKVAVNNIWVNGEEELGEFKELLNRIFPVMDKDTKRRVKLRRFVSACMRVDEPKEDANATEIPIFEHDMVPYYVLFVFWGLEKEGKKEAKKPIKTAISRKRKLENNDMCMARNEVLSTISVLEALLRSERRDGQKNHITLHSYMVFGFLKNLLFYKEDVLTILKNSLFGLVADPEFIPCSEKYPALNILMTHMEASGACQEENINRKIVAGFSEKMERRRIEETAQFIEGYSLGGTFDTNGEYRSIPRELCRYFEERKEDSTEDKWLKYMNDFHGWEKSTLYLNSDKTGDVQDEITTAVHMRNWMLLISFLELDLKKDSYFSIMLYGLFVYRIWDVLLLYGEKKNFYDAERKVSEKTLKECYGAMYSFLDSIKDLERRFDEMACLVEKVFDSVIRDTCKEGRGSYSEVFDQTLIREMLYQYTTIY